MALLDPRFPLAQLPRPLIPPIAIEEPRGIVTGSPTGTRPHGRSPHDRPSVRTNSGQNIPMLRTDRGQKRPKVGTNPGQNTPAVVSTRLYIRCSPAQPWTSFSFSGTLPQTLHHGAQGTKPRAHGQQARKKELLAAALDIRLPSFSLPHSSRVQLVSAKLDLLMKILRREKT